MSMHLTLQVKGVTMSGVGRNCQSAVAWEQHGSDVLPEKRNMSCPRPALACRSLVRAHPAAQLVPYV